MSSFTYRIGLSMRPRRTLVFLSTRIFFHPRQQSGGGRTSPTVEIRCRRAAPSPHRRQEEEEGRWTRSPPRGIHRRRTKVDDPTPPVGQVSHPRLPPPPPRDHMVVPLRPHSPRPSLAPSPRTPPSLPPPPPRHPRRRRLVGGVKKMPVTPPRAHPRAPRSPLP